LRDKYRLRQHLFFLALLFCLPAAAATPAAPPVSTKASTGVSTPGSTELELAPCELTAARGLVMAEAECGWLSVAENPARPQDRSLDLRVAVFRARADEPLADPLFFFAGGPGQSAVESFPIVTAALSAVQKERDIVLIDQRGTGASNPLRCPLPADLMQLLRRPSTAQIEQYTVECLQQLDADTRYYNTTQAAADFDAVRQALGYQRINLFGISYGTRVAQVYLRHYPAAVRSVILDGVVPMELILGSEHALRLEQTLVAVFARCAAETACNSAFPGVSQQFEALKQKLSRSPTQIEVTLPLSGSTRSIEFTQDMMAAALRMLAYQPGGQALLPLLVYEAATEGRYQRLASMALMILDSLNDVIYRGLEVSVMCAEDAPFFPATPLHPDTLLGDSLIEVSQQQCQLWPHHPVGADFHEPVTSEVPVLLLSGEYDPVTPPAYAEQVLRHYPNGRHLIGPGQGHGISSSGCTPQLIAEFLKLGSGTEIDADCLAEMGTSPFFTTLLGGDP
jgi:pimeloyl-ACP methyl ester carboxylesterase